MKSATATWLDSLPDKSVRDSAQRDLFELSEVVGGGVRFLLGAGMSRASGIPLTAFFAKLMTTNILEGRSDSRPASKQHEFAASYPFDAVAQTYTEISGRARLDDLLRREIEGIKTSPHNGHNALAELASRGLVDRVYTTNFDRLIEDGLSVRGRLVTDINVSSLPGILRDGDIPVLHLHGALEHNNCLMEESQIALLQTPLAQVLAGEMAIYPFVLVGYSLSDRDLFQIYETTRRIVGKAHRRSFVVHPLTSFDSKQPEEYDSKEYGFAQKVWASRNFTFVPGRAEEFLPALAEEVSRVDAEKICTAILKHRGRDPNDSTERLHLWDEANAQAEKVGSERPEDSMKALAIRYEVTEL